MTDSLCITVALIASALTVCFISLRRTGKCLQQARNEKEDILSEELRMFDFLHQLGEVTGRDARNRQLYKEIVEGFNKVLRADGGALYLLSEDEQSLIPQYMSPNCPALIGLPEDVKERSKIDARVLESHLRLAKVSVNEGVLGAAMLTGEPLLIENVKSHESFREATVNYDEEITALLSPLKYGGRNLGVVAIVRNLDNRIGAFTDNDFQVFRTVSEQSAFAMGNALIHSELVEKRKLEAEVRTASEVQNILLPSRDPDIPGFRVCGKNTPARMISGDYFDYIDLGNESTGIVIADVTGKGVPAGLLMVMCRSVMRLIAKAVKTPSAALALLNRQLFPDVREDMFVSLAYVILKHGEGGITLSRAGHDAPLMFHAKTGDVDTIKPPGLAIGIDEGEVFERVTKEISLTMERGDCLLLYTDGVCEAVNTQEEEYGKQRLIDIFHKMAPRGAEAVVESIQASVMAFAGEEPQMDDITLIVIEKC